MRLRTRLNFLLPIVACAYAGDTQTCDVLIRNALIYDGSGAPPRHGEVAISANTIAHVGPAAPVILEAAGSSPVRPAKEAGLKDLLWPEGPRSGVRGPLS